ncbi:ATP-binding protein [Pseudoalteromonas sp. S16_S37]|uniref:ATP-binding protein n=1 Tax=Pseudoalteromonas sp. S16_S37 TaxID=2720228 RepID=UPI00406D074C
MSVSKHSVCIELCDEGPGIAERDIERIFEPFERLSKVRESDQGGFGLGLPTVKAIVEGHDGQIKLNNMNSP